MATHDGENFFCKDTKKIEIKIKSKKIMNREG